MRINGLTGHTTWPLSPALLELVELFQSFYKMPDPGALLITLATYAAFRLPGENPLWMMLVGGSSTGKTAMIKILYGMPGVYPQSTLTRAGLLSGTKRKDWGPGASGGLLNEIGNGNTGFLVFKDFTSVLDDTREGSQNETISALREIHDGAYVRQVGTDGSRLLSWHGQLGILAACTTAINKYRSVMSILGDRFLFYPMASIDSDQLEEIAAQARLNADKAVEQQATLLKATTEFLAQIPDEWPDRSDEDYNQCLDGLSALVSRCRSQVERNRYSREVEHIYAPEGPSRISGQLARLDAGLMLIGVPTVRRYQLIRSTAFYCIPPVRHTVLSQLIRNPDGLSMSTLVESPGFGDSTVRRAVEELVIHKVIRRSGLRPNYRYSLEQEWRERWQRHPVGSRIMVETGQVVEFARFRSAENCKTH